MSDRWSPPYTPPDQMATARIVSREAAVLCGQPWVNAVFRALDPTRPVHYEGVHWDPRYPQTTDVTSQMYTPAAEVDRLLLDAGIVRHRGKIESVLNNARRTQELIRAEGSLAAWIWRHEPAVPEQAAHQGVTTSPTSVQLSKQLKKRGFSFVGPTTVHAFLQAMGLINDHAAGCVVHARVEAARAALERPG